MKCIFCQKLSDNSKSFEHVIPESMGNRDYILEPGIVCDECNNFFSIKIEKPLLELPFFRQSRHKTNTKSKKGKIPPDEGFTIYPGISKVFIKKDKSTVESFELEDKSIIENLNEFDYVPLITIEYCPPGLNHPLISKFLCKVAIEGLVFDVCQAKESIENNVNQPYFDLIRRFCRFPKSNELWPYQIRRVLFTDSNEKQSADNFLKEIVTDFNYIFIKPGYLLLIISLTLTRVFR